MYQLLTQTKGYLKDEYRYKIGIVYTDVTHANKYAHEIEGLILNMTTLY